MKISGKTGLIALAVIVIAVLAYYLLRTTVVTEDSSLNVEVKRGEFQITVLTTGELEAKNFVKINGPTGLRAVRIWQVKIADLIPEGTFVKKGDYIGELDKTEITSNIKDEESEVAKAQSQFIQSKLDTTLSLRKARDEITNMNYTVQEKQIIVEQSTYEPPATIRQVTNDLEKAKRELEQAKKNYKVQQDQAIAKMQEVSATLQIAQNKLDLLQDVLKDFTFEHLKTACWNTSATGTAKNWWSALASELGTRWLRSYPTSL